MIKDIEEYFAKGCGRCHRFDTPDCSTRRWIDGLTELRDLCNDAGLVETVKWGHPCYMHAGRNVAIRAPIVKAYLAEAMGGGTDREESR